MNVVAVSSHVLDSLRGTHAAGIRCVLQRIEGDSRRPVFDIIADAEGRILQEITLADGDAGSEFELVLHAAEYFAAQGITSPGCVREVVIRFVVGQVRRYHLPVMLAPHSYSTWWSD